MDANTKMNNSAENKRELLEYEAPGITDFQISGLVINAGPSADPDMENELGD